MTLVNGTAVPSFRASSCGWDTEYRVETREGYMLNCADAAAFQIANSQTLFSYGTCKGRWDQNGTELMEKCYAQCETYWDSGECPGYDDRWTSNPSTTDEVCEDDPAHAHDFCLPTNINSSNCMDDPIIPYMCSKSCLTGNFVRNDQRIVWSQDKRRCPEGEVDFPYDAEDCCDDPNFKWGNGDCFYLEETADEKTIEACVRDGSDPCPSVLHQCTLPNFAGDLARKHCPRSCQIYVMGPTITSQEYCHAWGDSCAGDSNYPDIESTEDDSTDDKEGEEKCDYHLYPESMVTDCTHEFIGSMSIAECQAACDADRECSVALYGIDTKHWHGICHIQGKCSTTDLSLEEKIVHSDFYDAYVKHSCSKVPVPIVDPEATEDSATTKPAVTQPIDVETTAGGEVECDYQIFEKTKARNCGFTDEWGIMTLAECQAGCNEHQECDVALYGHDGDIFIGKGHCSFQGQCWATDLSLEENRVPLAFYDAYVKQSCSTDPVPIVEVKCDYIHYESTIAKKCSEYEFIGVRTLADCQASCNEHQECHVAKYGRHDEYLSGKGACFMQTNCWATDLSNPEYGALSAFYDAYVKSSCTTEPVPIVDPEDTIDVETTEDSTTVPKYTKPAIRPPVVPLPIDVESTEDSTTVPKYTKPAIRPPVVPLPIDVETTEDSTTTKPAVTIPIDVETTAGGEENCDYLKYEKTMARLCHSYKGLGSMTLADCQARCDADHECEVALYGRDDNHPEGACFIQSECLTTDLSIDKFRTDNDFLDAYVKHSCSTDPDAIVDPEATEDSTTTKPAVITPATLPLDVETTEDSTTVPKYTKPAIRPPVVPLPIDVESTEDSSTVPKYTKPAIRPPVVPLPIEVESTEDSTTVPKYTKPAVIPPVTLPIDVETTEEIIPLPEGGETPDEIPDETPEDEEESQTAVIVGASTGAAAAVAAGAGTFFKMKKPASVDSNGDVDIDMEIEERDAVAEVDEDMFV